MNDTSIGETASRKPGLEERPSPERELDQVAAASSPRTCVGRSSCKGGVSCAGLGRREQGGTDVLLQHAGVLDRDRNRAFGREMIPEARRLEGGQACPQAGLA